MGAPILVASRYQPQQYLIGPSIFPVYWYVMRMALLCVFIIYSLVTAVAIPIMTSNGAGVVDSLVRIPGILITVAAWVTLSFAVIEFAAIHYPGKCPPIDGLCGEWSPSSLPPLDEAPAARRKQRSYAQAVAEVVFGFLFLFWLLLLPRHPFLIMGPGIFYWQSSPFQLASAWMTIFWWLVALNATQLTWRCVDLLRGAWEHPSRMQHICSASIGLIACIQLATVRDHIFVTLKHPALDQLRQGNTLNTINKSVHLGLLIVHNCSIATGIRYRPDGD
jgi:hypothetical protein